MDFCVLFLLLEEVKHESTLFSPSEVIFFCLRPLVASLNCCKNTDGGSYFHDTLMALRLDFAIPLRSIKVILL